MPAPEAFREDDLAMMATTKQAVEPQHDIAMRPAVAGAAVTTDLTKIMAGKVLNLPSLKPANPAFLEGCGMDAAWLSVFHDNRRPDDAFDYVRSIIEGVNPRDEVEVLLATQMAAVHLATMTAAERLADASVLMHHNSQLNALNKLARTFTTQVEALKRYRSKGEQKVTVEHVTVNAGGQAIVGAVGTGRGKHE